MFDVNLAPDVSAQPATVVVAQAKPAQKGKAVSAQRTIGICQLVESHPDSHVYAYNVIGPARAVRSYVSQVERRPVGRQGKIDIVQMPAQGDLRVTPSGNYRYFPLPNYYGEDRATLLVGIGNRKIRVTYFFNVLPKVPAAGKGYDPYRDRKLCPNGKRWKISLGSGEGSATQYGLAQYASFYRSAGEASGVATPAVQSPPAMPMQDNGRPS